MDYLTKIDGTVGDESFDGKFHQWVQEAAKTGDIDICKAIFENEFLPSIGDFKKNLLSKEAAEEIGFETSHRDCRNTRPSHYR